MYVTREQLDEIYALESPELERRTAKLREQQRQAHDAMRLAYDNGEDLTLSGTLFEQASRIHVLHAEEQWRRGEGDSRGSTRPRQ